MRVMVAVATLLLANAASSLHAEERLCRYEDLMLEFFALEARSATRGVPLAELARLPPDEVRLSAQRFLESRSVSARMQPSRKE